MIKHKINLAHVVMSLIEYNITPSKVHKDGTVDVDGSVEFIDRDFEYLPIKFGSVRSFIIDRCNRLKSLIGCPTEIGAVCFIENCASLSSIENLPERIGRYLCVTNCKNVKSLIGVKSKGREIKFDWTNITSGGISVMLNFEYIYAARGTHWNSGPFNIIAKYMKSPADVFECQVELIEAGYMEHAKL